MTAPRPFIIIGENIHATRIVLRSGRHVRVEGDREQLVFTDGTGRERRLPVPEWHTQTDEHLSGRLKHVAIAIRTAMDGGATADDGLAYLEMLVRRQVDAGAAYLDLNVDELSPRLPVQKAAMVWLVQQVCRWSPVPVSVDSSHGDIIAAGLGAAPPGSRPLLNSASLERRSSLDLAQRIGGPVVVTAGGSTGMPSGVDDRVANASVMVDAALALGFAPGDVYVDPLIFPISVGGGYGKHALEAVGTLRARFGLGIHITGGMSNVSFGIPGRHLLNDVFLRMAIEAGADSGIIDPVATDIAHVMALDVEAPGPVLARDAILGIDVDCRAFLRAYRKGELAEYGVVPPVRSRP